MRNTDENNLQHFSALKRRKHLSCIDKSSAFYLRVSRFLFHVFAFGRILHFPFNHEAFGLFNHDIARSFITVLTA